jgi:hypothetical protein
MELGEVVLPNAAAKEVAPAPFATRESPPLIDSPAKFSNPFEGDGPPPTAKAEANSEMNPPEAVCWLAWVLDCFS